MGKKIKRTYTKGNTTIECLIEVVAEVNPNHPDWLHPHPDSEGNLMVLHCTTETRASTGEVICVNRVDEPDSYWDDRYLLWAGFQLISESTVTKNGEEEEI